MKMKKIMAYFYDFAELDALVKMFRHFTTSRPPSYSATAKYLNEQGIPLVGEANGPESMFKSY